MQHTTFEKAGGEIVGDELEPEKKANKASLSAILSPSGDSDKENWSPDEDGNPLRRRALPAAAVAAKPQTSPLMAGNPRRMGRILGDQGASKR